MHKLSYKTLFTILFFLLIGVVILSRFVLPNKKVSASWWNDSWNYRQAINISSHNTNESNVYIITSVNIGTTTKSQTDNGDFRFITQSGDILPYYISSGTGTTNITFHVQFSSFPSGAQTIFAYYGNSTVTNGFSVSDFSTQASNYAIGSLSAEEAGGGPIAYWKFDEGVGSTAYDSAGSNNGTLSGSTLPTWQTEENCISGKCLQYNGVTSSVSTPYINLTNQFTASVWIKGNSFSNDNGLFYQCETAAVNKCMHLVIRSGIPYLGFYGVDLSGNTTLQPNIWYFITFVYDGTHQKIYINGKLDASVASVAYNGLSGNTYIGQAWGGGGNGGFNGILDEVKIYHYARTTDQIKLDYNSRGSTKGSSVNLGIKSSTAPSISSNLIAHYKFDENNGTKASNSGNAGIGLSGIFATGNSAPTWVDGKKNKALSFNRSQYLTVNDNSAFTIGSDGFTYSAWIKAYSFPDTFNMIMGHYLPYFQVYPDGKLHLSMNADGGQKSVVGNTVLGSNNWYHVSATYNNQGYMKVYVNGKLDGTAGPYPNPTTFSSNFYIGKWYSGDEYKFNGIIDEVKVYNKALTAEEVKQDYNQGSATTFGTTNQTIGGTTTSLEYCITGDTSHCAPPIAEWNFEENTGNSAKDISGNNLIGTFGTGNSAPIWTTGKNNSGSGLNISSNGQYVKVPLGALTSSFTTGTSGKTLSFSLWFKPNNVSGTNQYLLTNNDPCNNPGNFSLILSNGILYFNYYSSGGASQVTQSFTPSIALQNNRWYHLEWTKTFGQLGVRAYLNGINQAVSGDSTLTGYSDRNNIVLGAWSGTGYTCTSGVDEVPPIANMSFFGSLDQIRIYDYIRTPAQIAYDYNKGSPMSHWKFDECQGLIAFDSSGSGYTGSINIGPSGTQNTAGTCQIGTSAAWTNGASGKINSSLKFDGNDDFMTAPIPIGGTEATISFWVKNPAAGAGNYLLRSNANVRTYIQISGSTISFTKGNPYVSIPGGNINTSIWNQIVIKWWTNNNITYAKTYINGKPTTSDIGTSFTDNSKSSYITIAGFDTTGTQNTSGQFDDVRIYNYSLTDEQIKTVYNNGAINFN